MVDTRDIHYHNVPVITCGQEAIEKKLGEELSVMRGQYIELERNYSYFVHNRPQNKRN